MKGKVPLTPAALSGYLQLPQELAERLISTEPIEKYYDVEEEPFARGKYATVRRCRERSSGLQFAAKFLRKRCRSKDNRPEILHEVAVLEACRSSSRVVKLHQVFESSTDMVLLLELASGGELQMLLDADDVPTETQVQTLMKQIMEGILYLHSINIAHLDLKPQNLVLTRKFPDCDVKLCDFGISRYLTQGADVREILGTPDYVAPEVLNYEPISLATDMWSVGVLMYVLLTGCSPFGGETKQETFCNITQCRLDFPDDLFEEISEEAKDLMTKLMVKNPDARLTANDCVKHSWFTKTFEDSPSTPIIPASPNLPRTPVPTKKPAPPEEVRTPENNNISVTTFIEEIQTIENKRNDNQPKITSLDRVDSFKARANGMQTMPVRPVAKQRHPLNINLNREIDAVTFKYRRVIIEDSDEASPPSSISSGYTSGSISSDNSICDTNSDTVSEMSIDSSSDRSSIISLDDSLDFSLNKGMLRHFSSCHNLWALKNQKPSTRSLPKECQGSFVRALSQLSRPVEVKESAFPIRTPKLAIFNNNRPTIPQISPGRKYLGVESMRERNGNLVVIREVKAINGLGYAKTCEVKCESVQARIRKFQMAPSPGKNDVF